MSGFFSIAFEILFYGTNWFNPEPNQNEPKTYSITEGQNIAEVLDKAADGDILEFASGNYTIPSSLKIDKGLTIQTKAPEDKVSFQYSGDSKTPLFEMNPKGNLTLKGIHLSGNQTQHAFASLNENMSSLYNLRLENCQIENFDCILKAYKYSFSEHITALNSTFKHCQNGFILSEEVEDKGEYNAENITLDGCMFDNIANNVIDYYRGGYDESTVGGNLSISKCSFSKCGHKEPTGILLNTYGIINVDISDNTFENNKVNRIAQLWGAKNNHHSNNKITNSGKIIVEENLKLKTFY